MNPMQSAPQSELQGAWRKSRHSLANQNCLEAGSGLGAVGVRDTQLGEDSPVVKFSVAAWRAFTEGLQAPTP